MSAKYDNFCRVVLDYYQAHGRDLPWRNSEPDGSFDPYKILVSEIMLQQTQVSRVIPKYQQFLVTFPSVDTVARASLGDVLSAWNGLGYNRRAKYLWQTARALANGNDFPRTVETLVALPGIGKNTAAAILVYAFNQPELFIETNIRTVYIHHFFANKQLVSDAELVPLLEKTVDRNNPRIFYWALMDYGSFLKATTANESQKSKSFVRQSKFQGSLREIRGQVVKLLTSGPLTAARLRSHIKDQRLADVVDALESEGLIEYKPDGQLGLC